MPAVTSGKALVTGANGFLATWIIRKLLERGFSVRGTVRSESKIAPLKQVFADFGDKFEVVVVEDITKKGAFDEAVKGVDLIQHPASPVHMNAIEPDEQIVPAVNGTVGVLESALAYGTSVKRVVYTSSCGAVRGVETTTPRRYSEADWNEASVADVRARGRAAGQLSKYQASKVLAERAAWDFVEKHKGSIGWDLVACCPPWIFGPTLQPVKEPEQMNDSMRIWFQATIKGTDDSGIPQEKEFFTKFGMTWIDVRDAAEALIVAGEKEQAAGERIIISNGPWKGQDLLNAARKYYPQVPVGDETYHPATATHLTTFDTSKADRLLGVKYRTLEDSTRDIIEQFKGKGWI
ncbi:NAD(P)-binding protein [Daedalea quercina L-15889]|uniref:NAD(P)-binding protein n=1 Tax=Daedalea quercina L-15889 TaxID=1314783 RepID=A0A165TLP5_9APHY|nr:NAD(P)-binding protein [Daedalea quercina L-15889]